MTSFFMILIIVLIVFSGCSTTPRSFYEKLGYNIIIDDTNNAVTNLDNCYSAVQATKQFSRFTIDKVTCDEGKCLCE